MSVIRKHPPHIQAIKPTTPDRWVGRIPRISSGHVWRAICVLVLAVASASAQHYEITPMIGGMFGGTIGLEQQGVPNFNAHLQDRLSYGISGGVRYDADECDKCDRIEFRWMRQRTHLALSQDNPLVITPPTTPSFYPSVALNEFLGDFTREIPTRERAVRPFVTVSLGAARMSTPEASATRFAFGLSAGVDIFPKHRWGIRFQTEYLPVVMEANLQRVICAGGGCIVALSGGVMNQFHVSIGPAFRF